jgi:ferric enterobactin receptor
MKTRAPVIVMVWSALVAMPGPAMAQHEHHGGPPALDTVKIAAERDVIELRSGSTIVNVRKSGAAGGSVADLLRTVPGVDVDAEGRISMRGSRSVLVLMNGRRTALTGDALGAFLRQMPAAALERIEAGTTVSARHGADGAAGVVNLVSRDDSTRRTAMRSLAGSMATDDHYMGSAAAAGDVGDLLSWDVMYSLSGTRPRTDSRTLRWSLVPGDLPLETDQNTVAREKHRLHSVLAGLVVTPTPSTSVALRGTYSAMKGAYRGRSAFLYRNAAGDTDASTTGSRTDHVIPSGEISAVGTINRGPLRFSSEARASFVDEDFRGVWSDEDAGYSYKSTIMDSRQRERVLRTNLGILFSGMEVDAGHESRFRESIAEHDVTHFNATGSQRWRYSLDVHAGYVSARRHIRGVRATAGLRVEADRTRIRLDTASSRAGVHLFPNFSGEWTDARRALVYRVAYGRRIERPGSEMLSPFHMSEDDTNEIVGNPSLLPEVSDQVELGVERHGASLTVQLTPFLRWARDPIRPLVSSTPSGGSTTTLENLTRARAAGADASLRARVAGSAVFTLAGSVAHMQTTGKAFRSSGLYGTARLDVDLRIAENTSMQLYAYRRSAQAIEQGRILPVFSSEVAMTHRLAGDRARVTMRLNDPLRSDRLEFRVADATFTQETRRRTARSLLSLFVSYAVGGAPRQDTPVRTEGPARIF